MMPQNHLNPHGLSVFYSEGFRLWAIDLKSSLPHLHPDTYFIVPKNRLSLSRRENRVWVMRTPYSFDWLGLIIAMVGSGVGAVVAVQAGGSIFLIVLAVLVMAVCGIGLSLNFAVLKDYQKKRDALVDGMIVPGEILSCERKSTFPALHDVIQCVFTSPESGRRIQITAVRMGSGLYPYPQPTARMPVAVLFVNDWTYSLL